MRFGQGRALRVEEAQDLAHSDGVIRNGDLLLGHRLAVDMLHDAHGVADALHDALRDSIARFGVDELILDGGGPRVNDENGGNRHV